MSWIYSQGKGLISRDALMAGTGYSGHGEGLNNHLLEADKGIGPIPRGRWKIVRWDAQHADKGPVVGVLEPVGHDAYGRSGFLIHGAHENDHHDSSHGCIVTPRTVRETMQYSGDTDLFVT